MEKLRIYMGFDSREKEAYEVCMYSIQEQARCPVEVIALSHRTLRRQGYFNRPWLVEANTGNWVDLVDGRPFSTEFAFTRFLVPRLNNYKGWAIFMDCDMLALGDFSQVMQYANPKYAALVVKHNYKPDNTLKMDGVTQAQYYRKNWSSFILWNCAHPKNRYLTPELVSTKSGRDLHALSWLADEDIGSLPETFNWIEGCCQPIDGKPINVHYTNGGPWFMDRDGVKKDILYSDEWWTWQRRWKDSETEKTIEEICEVDYASLA